MCHQPFYQNIYGHRALPPPKALVEEVPSDAPAREEPPADGKALEVQSSAKQAASAYGYYQFAPQMFSGGWLGQGFHGIMPQGMPLKQMQQMQQHSMVSSECSGLTPVPASGSPAVCNRTVFLSVTPAHGYPPMRTDAPGHDVGASFDGGSISCCGCH